MKILGALLALAIAVGMLAPTSVLAQGHHKAPEGCPPGGRHAVIAADTQAEVYGIRKNSETIEYRGCVYGQTRSFVVGGVSECLSGGGACGGTRHITLAGTLVARELSVISPVLGTKYLVEVESLRSGQILHKVPTGVPQTVNPKIIGAGPTTAIVMKSDGAVAWINEKVVAAGTEYEVHALDKSGERLLASGTDIGAQSLALAGSTLYWTQGKVPESATLE